MSGKNIIFLPKTLDKPADLCYTYYRKKEREVTTMTKYTVTINEKTYNTNSRDTVMCLLAENPNAKVEIRG